MEIRDTLMIAFGFKLTKPDLFLKTYGKTANVYFDFRVKQMDKCCYLYFEDETDIQEIKKRILDEFWAIRNELGYFITFEQNTECLGCGKKSICHLEEYNNWWGCNKSYYICSYDCDKKALKFLENEDRLERKDEEEEKVQELMKTFEKRDELKCSHCGKKPDLEFYSWGDPKLKSHHKHNTDYKNDIVIIMCPSCHAKITFHLDKYPELKKYEPEGTRKEYLKIKKKPRKKKSSKKEDAKPKKEKKVKKYDYKERKRNESMDEYYRRLGYS